jgi:hypothetical protein
MTPCPLCHELLASLKEMLPRALDDGTVYCLPIPDDNLNDDFKAEVDRARAVIAKAEQAIRDSELPTLGQLRGLFNK